MNRRALGFAAIVFALADLVLLLPGWAAHGAQAVPGAMHLDAGMQFVAWLEQSRAVLSGALPEWNPYLLVGGPLLASFEAALIYPPRWIQLLFDVPLGLMLSRFAHLLIAQLGAWVLVRRVGGSSAGALIAGLAFAFSGQSVFRIDAGHVYALDGLAWTPWLVLAAVEATQGRLRRGLVLGCCASTLQLTAGYPQLAWVTWVGLAVLVPGLAVAAGHRGASLLRRCGLFLTVVPAVTSVLAAGALLPAFELARRSARAGFDPAWVGTLSLTPESALTLVAPQVFGGGPVPYWGRGYAWENTVYAGAIPFLLAVWAVVKLPRRRTLPWIVAGAWLGLLALGSNGPLLLPLAKLVPGMGAFRSPTKFLWPATLILSVLAGLGATPVRGWAAASGRRWAVAALAAVGVALVALLPADAGRAWVRALATTGEHFATVDVSAPALQEAAAGAHTALVVGGLWIVAALFVIAGRRRLGTRLSAKFLVALTLVELLGASHERVRFFNADTLRLDPRLLSVLRSERARVALLTEGINRPMASRLESLLGYKSILAERTNAFYNAWAGLPADARVFLRLTPRVDRVTRLLNQRFVCVPEGRGLPLAWRVQPELVHIARVAGVDVYRDPGALARAFVVETARPLETRARVLEEVLSPEFDPKRAVLLEGHAPPLPDLPAQPAASERGAEVVSYAPDAVEVRARLSKPGYLVLSDAFDPGWRASVGGQPVPIVPAYGLVRAVRLPAGDHPVRFEYRPPAVRIGLAISLAGALLLAGVLLWTRRQPDEL